MSALAKLKGQTQEGQCSNEHCVKGKYMIGLILTGYGKMPEGMLDALEAVSGPAEAIETVGFADMTEEELRSRLEDAYRKLSDEDCESVLFLCDMAGGVPYRLAAEQADGKCCEVLAGLNLGMLVEADTVRSFTGDVSRLAEQIAEVGRDQVERFAVKN